MRTILLGVLLVVFGNMARAQTLQVTVVDKDSRQPVMLAYVNIYEGVSRSPYATEQTNELGVAQVIPGKYPCTLEIAAAGYESAEMQLMSVPVNPNISISLLKKFSSLNEVVVTGLSQPQKLKDALSSYQVITKSTIQAQGAVSLNDVLKNQLNMSVSNDNVLGSSINMQGMTGNKVKILIDGMPLNGREAGNINLSQINMNNVERIEIIQGPMSVVYGTDALGGVINVITKKENKPFGFSAGWYYESVNKYNFDGSLTFKVKDRHQFTVGGGRNFFEGWKYVDNPVTYNGDTLRPQRNLYFKPNLQYVGNIGYTYKAKSGFGLQFASDYLNEKITSKGNLHIWDPFQGAYAFDEYYYTERYMNRLSANGKLGKKGKWQSQNGYFIYYRNKNRVNKDLVNMQEIPTKGKGDQDTSTFKNVYLRGSYDNSVRKFNYTVGYDINLEDANSLKINGRCKSIQDYAVYANGNMPVVKDKLTAQVGLRAAYNTSYTPPLIPSFNLLYTPAEKWQVRASYSQGFRAPSLKEMYLSFIDDNHNIIGNTNLLAEKSDHIQASVSYQFYEYRANYLQLIFTAYYNNVSNGIVLVKVHPDDTANNEYIYGNLSHQSNVIASPQLDGQWNNFHFVVGYSFNHTFEEKGNYSAFSASEANATLQYRWKKPGISINAFYKFTGAQPYLQMGVDGSAIYNGRQGAYQFLDASVEKKLLENKLQLVVGVKNILDVQMPTTTGVTTSSVHGGSGVGSFLPRSLFTSLRLNID